MVGAQAGYGAAYDDPEGDMYAVEVLRWAFPKKAQRRGNDLYSGEWPVYVTLGNFGFAGQGPNVDEVHTLLDHSPALPPGYSKENNMKT